MQAESLVLGLGAVLLGWALHLQAALHPLGGASRRSEPAELTCLCKVECPTPEGVVSVYIAIGLGAAALVLAFLSGLAVGSCCPRAAVRHRVQVLEHPSPPTRGKGSLSFPALQS